MTETLMLDCAETAPLTAVVAHAKACPDRLPTAENSAWPVETRVPAALRAIFPCTVAALTIAGRSVSRTVMTAWSPLETVLEHW
jgi:hypothetical protein